MMVGIMGEMIVQMMVKLMEKKCVNELSPHDMYACPQLVMLEATLVHLSPTLELRIK
jgi:hypothetical protein